MATRYVITFRNPATGGVLLDPAITQGLALLSGDYEFLPTGNTTRISVQGVSRGVTAVDFTLNHPGGPTTISSTPDPGSGIFAATFSAVSAVPGDLISIEAKARGGTATDRGIFQLYHTGPVLHSGSAIALGPTRHGFVAGVPDRIVRSRYFTPLMIEVPVLGNHSIVGVFTTEGDLVTVDARALGRATENGLRTLFEKGRTGDMSMKVYQQERKRILIDALPGVAKRERLDMLEPEKKETLRPDPDVARSTRRQSLPADFLGALRNLVALEPNLLRNSVPRYFAIGGHPDVGAEVGIGYGPFNPGDLQRAFDDLLDDVFHKSIMQLPLGILFSDRLRFQPAGLVIGEKLYTISLAPGEEVQLRQVVETKRQIVAEDVKDRETEQQLTLSSTWTTEITDVLRESQSTQTSSTFGTNLGTDLASVGIPVNAGGNATFTGASADQTSQEQSRSQNHEATVTAASRMRAQHKVRFEVTNEASSSLATTRTLRNHNRQRAVTHIFHKIYRKDRVTLERVNAQLCLRLEVVNPAAATRASFVEGLRKIDPDNPENYNLAVPQSVDSTWKIMLDGPDANWHPTGSDEEEGSGVNTAIIPSFKLKTKFGVATSGDIPSTYVLVDMPRMTIDEFKWGSSRRYGNASFDETGGTVEWTTEPALKVADPSGTLKTTLRWVKTVESYRSMRDVKATFKALWVPSDVDLAAYSLSRAQERSRLLQDLQASQIYELRDIAIANFPGFVLGEAIRDNLVTGPELNAAAEIFDLKGLYIEVLPHWATDSGRKWYSSLHAKLERLPIFLKTGEIIVNELTASKARVYLPVKEGMEDTAVGLLNGVPPSATTHVVQNVRQFRDSKYPIYTRSVDSIDAICGPQPPAVTPMDRNSWQQEWEKPRRMFQVLAQWQELFPTDGVHLEMVLSESVASDEALTDMIGREGR